MHKLSIGIFALLSIVSCEKVLSLDSPQDDLVVSLATPAAKIRGHVLKSDKGLDYYAFQEIPYAKPPVGKLRFKAPERPDEWKGVLNTTQNTKICLQPFPSFQRTTEDCLYLNVYTPVKPGSKKKLSVYVWIHGGAYIGWGGNIEIHGPKYLIDYNIVVVTLNYRLGVLGFLATEDGVIPGNLALHDQNLALRWVQENIGLFGGDPRKVTLGGESAGANSVGAHLLSPRSKGLFRAAILQSGSALNTWAYQNNPNEYAFQTGRILDSSFENNDTTRLLEILQNATEAQILDAGNKVVNLAPSISVIPDLIWTLTLETAVKEEDAFLWKPYEETFLHGSADDWNMVPQLCSTNSMEILWFTEDGHHPGPLTVNNETLNKNIARLDEDLSRLVNVKYNIPDVHKKEVGTEMRKFYTNTTFLEDKSEYLRFAGDIYFSLPVIRHAVLASQHVPVYLAKFEYSPPANWSFSGESEHTEELQYLWENIEDAPFTDEHQLTIRRQMLKLWTNFIKYRNPTPDVDETLDNVKWPKVKAKTVPYLNINNNLTISSNLKNYLQIEPVLDEYKEPPMIVF